MPGVAPISVGGDLASDPRARWTGSCGPGLWASAIWYASPCFDDDSIITDIFRAINLGRLWALLRRHRRAQQLPPVNAKRVYRLVRQHHLLLQRYTGSPPARAHVAVKPATSATARMAWRRTPYRSPQSNRMAESFVKNFKRDYVRINPTPDAATVLAQLHAWFTDYNFVHPHSALKYRSPEEFREDQQGP